MNEAIDAYHAGLLPEDRAICDRLAAAIEHGLPGAASKVWHAHPVWFLDGSSKNIVKRKGRLERLK